MQLKAELATCKAREAHERRQRELAEKQLQRVQEDLAKSRLRVRDAEAKALRSAVERTTSNSIVTGSSTTSELPVGQDGVLTAQEHQASLDEAKRRVGIAC